MKRKLLLVLAFIALPGFASALGLGKLQLNSTLNQPFDARIELLSVSASELDSLVVGLADTVAFKRAKIDRPFVLSKLKFEVKQNENGPDYIQISSQDAIHEPFLNFLLEAGWSTGRLYREYTVLLDPPLYDPNPSRAARSESYTPPSASSSSSSYVIDDAEDNSTQSTAPGISYGDNEYGPTETNDTLWSIATRVRPDSSVSVQQMMMALLRANPGAFLNGNINGLKRGQILNIPAREEIDVLSSQDAIADVKLQNSSWQEGRGLMAEAATDRADSMSTVEDRSQMSASDESSSMIGDDESELRLVAASSDGAGIGQDGGKSGSDNNENLALANEKIETVSQENAELKDRMQEAETIIEDLKRLISLKDDELAALQQQMASGAASVVEQVTPTEVMADPEEEVIEDVAVDEAPIAEATEEFAVEEEEADESTVDDAVAEEVDEADAVEEQMDEETGVEDSTVAAEQTVTPSPGMLDKVLGFVMGNLIMIAGALAGLIILVISLLFISRRKQNAANEPAPVATADFPDFDDSEAETGPGADVTVAADMDVDVSEEETVLPVEDAGEGNKTEFVAPPVPQEKPAAAAEPEEPEEDPLAEVNVFLAYEHFDQAEEFVREAIAGNPNNLDFHAKLLEVFYASNDKKSYEEAAQVLHDKVNGEGSHWDMARAMWQEMSPNRALFEEGADDATAPVAAESAGGIMDITAEESDARGAKAGLDFDLGMDMGAAPAVVGAGNGEEDVLDITAAGDDEDILGVTTAVAVNGDSSDEDLLDVTAAVGLETEEFVEYESVVTDDEPMLDLTSGGEEISDDEEDVLDISHGSGQDLLDVTANANLEEDGLEEDLLDVTAVGAEADGEELLEVSAEDSAVADNSVDFDIGGMDLEADVADAAGEAEIAIEATPDDNSLDFDIGGMDIEPQSGDSEAEADEGNIIDIDMGTTDDAAGIKLDMDSDVDMDDGGVELDLSMDDGVEEADDVAGDINEISIDDLQNTAEEDLEIDLSIDDSDSDSLDIGDLEIESRDDLEIDLTLDDDGGDNEEESLDAAFDMDFDLEIQDDSSNIPEIEMDGTVEMPKLEMGIDVDDDDDDDNHTVFVPRAGIADEQSSEDEIATKLDLAKAYVELGDKDSARSILDEVLVDGNDEQKQAAQDLIKQLD